MKQLTEIRRPVVLFDLDGTLLPMEYDRFEKGAANGNKSTAILQRQLENKDSKGNPHEYKIIVTTIQKLENFIKKNEKWIFVPGYIDEGLSGI